MDCSPSTHRIASTMQDFPEPFGPTIAVIPREFVVGGRNSSVDAFANDLNPEISMRWSHIGETVDI